jgi:hypothetical protein
MVTIYLYTVLVFHFHFLSCLSTKLVTLDVYPIYSRYLLIDFIYKKKEEEPLKLSTIDYQNTFKKVYLLISVVK